MFSGCESLKFLDISNFNMEQITDGESMFNGIKNLKYINLYNIQKSYNFISESGLNEIKDLTVCQKQKIISNDNINQNCCYYDLNTNECSNTNYIILFYGDRAEYENGFIKDKEDNEFRGGIDFIINGEDHNKKLDGVTELNLHKGSKIEIYFSNSIPLTSIQNYFSSSKDINFGKIISIEEDDSTYQISTITTQKNLENQTIKETTSQMGSFKSLKAFSEMLIEGLSKKSNSVTIDFCSLNEII